MGGILIMLLLNSRKLFTQLIRKSNQIIRVRLKERGTKLRVLNLYLFLFICFNFRRLSVQFQQHNNSETLCVFLLFAKHNSALFIVIHLFDLHYNPMRQVPLCSPVCERQGNQSFKLINCARSSLGFESRHPVLHLV